MIVPSKPSRDRTARIVAVLCVLLGAAACQPGTGGKLEPAPQQETGADGPYGGGSVKLVSNWLEIQVSGSWQNRRGANMIDAQVAYRNLGDHEVLLDAADFGTGRGRDRGWVAQVVDMTGVNLADDRTDNDDATQIINVYEGRTRGTIRLAPGERRIVELSTSLADGMAPLDDGQKVTIVVPTVRGIAETLFRVDDSWF